MAKTQLTEEEFFEKFRPIKNTLGDGEASFNGTMFETYGVELEKVRAADPRCVWTFVSGDGDAIVAGFHFVNRMGYFITEVPCEAEDQFVELESVCDDDEDAAE